MLVGGGGLDMVERVAIVKHGAKRGWGPTVHQDTRHFLSAHFLTRPVKLTQARSLTRGTPGGADSQREDSGIVLAPARGLAPARACTRACHAPRRAVEIQVIFFLNCIVIVDNLSEIYFFF